MITQLNHKTILDEVLEVACGMHTTLICCCLYGHQIRDNLYVISDQMNDCFKGCICCDVMHYMLHGLFLASGLDKTFRVFMTILGT